jgi:hypothetical protein
MRSEYESLQSLAAYASRDCVAIRSEYGSQESLPPTLQESAPVRLELESQEPHADGEFHDQGDADG